MMEKNDTSLTSLVKLLKSNLRFATETGYGTQIQLTNVLSGSKTLFNLSSTLSSAREISSTRKRSPFLIAWTRGPSCHWKIVCHFWCTSKRFLNLASRLFFISWSSRAPHEIESFLYFSITPCNTFKVVEAWPMSEEII